MKYELSIRSDYTIPAQYYVECLKKINSYTYQELVPAQICQELNINMGEYYSEATQHNISYDNSDRKRIYFQYYDEAKLFMGWLELFLVMDKLENI